MNTETRHLFDSTTQFMLDDDSIILRQGAINIASGQFADWLCLFQTFEADVLSTPPIKISKSIAGLLLSDDESILIQNPNSLNHQLKIHQSDLPILEERLIELGQGCCDPSPFNFVAEIAQEPDEILGLIQKITNFALSPEQLRLAKESISDLPRELEITFLDLYQLWEHIPALSSFTKVLRFYFLPA